MDHRDDCCGFSGDVEQVVLKFGQATCTACLCNFKEEVMANPVQFVFGTPKACHPELHPMRLRFGTQEANFQRLRKALVPGVLFQPIEPCVALVLLLRPPVTSEEEWFFLTTTCNHLSLATAKFHRQICTICSPSYTCFSRQGYPLFLFSNGERDFFFKLCLKLLETTDGYVTLSTVVVDGDYLTVPNDLVDLGGSLWIREGTSFGSGLFSPAQQAEVRRFLSCLINNRTFQVMGSRFMFKVAFLVVEKQRRHSEAVLNSLGFCSSCSHSLARQVGKNCHQAVANSLAIERQRLGFNQTFNTKLFGLRNFKPPGNKAASSSGNDRQEVVCRPVCTLKTCQTAVEGETVRLKLTFVPGKDVLFRVEVAETEPCAF
mmetsp:Transcript_4606/g.7273  ORF Transcript_4606/g.7273 Transcript_4606/m.7273 type:complete len:374 (+) Transcript_4606:358-1479(+)